MHSSNTLYCYFFSAIIGPWKRDGELSSKNSANQIELYDDHVKINESGLYFVYAQVRTSLVLFDLLDLAVNLCITQESRMDKL